MLEGSQPKILLYDDDPFIRISYPDFVEAGGTFYMTETQKSIGRIHRIPSSSGRAFRAGSAVKALTLHHRLAHSPTLATRKSC